MHSLEQKSHLLRPTQCFTSNRSSCLTFLPFSLPQLGLSLLWSFVSVLGGESQCTGIAQRGVCQDLSTLPCAPCLWTENILLLALQVKRKRWCYHTGEDLALLLTSLHPLCCKNLSLLACQLYYLPHTAVQTCSKTRTNVWSQKAQQQICPNKIPQTDGRLGYCPFKVLLKIFFSPFYIKLLYLHYPNARKS